MAKPERSSRVFKALVVVCVIASASIAIWATRAWRADDPLSAFTSMPRYQRASWHDDSLSEAMSRLDRLTRTREWSESDGEFVRALITTPAPTLSPRALAVAPVGIRMMAGKPESLGPDELEYADPPLSPFPAPGDEEGYARWAESTPEGREIARYFDWMRTIHTADSTVADRLRLNLPVPDSLRSFVLQRLLQSLSSRREEERIHAVGGLLRGRYVEDPDIRVRVDAVRLGDPSATVRAAVDAGLRIYDRDYHGIDPGPLVECNTCP